MSKKGGAATLQKDAPWRASPSLKPIPKIHHFPLLRLPQTPHSNYALSVMKVFSFFVFLLFLDAFVLSCIFIDFNLLGFVFCVFAASKSNRKWISNGCYSGSSWTRVYCPRPDYTHQITWSQGSSFSFSLSSKSCLFFKFYVLFFNSLNLEI